MRLRHLIVPGVKAPYHAGIVAARLVLRGGARFTCLDLAYGGYARGRVYYHVDLRRCEHCFSSAACNGCNSCCRFSLLFARFVVYWKVGLIWQCRAVLVSVM